jgi:hypothetical protein
MFGEQNNKKKIKNGEKIKANKKDFNGNNHHGSSIHLKFPPAKFPPLFFFLTIFFFYFTSQRKRTGNRRRRRRRTIKEWHFNI